MYYLTTISHSDKKPGSNHNTYKTQSDMSHLDIQIGFVF